MYSRQSTNNANCKQKKCTYLCVYLTFPLFFLGKQTLASYKFTTYVQTINKLGLMALKPITPLRLEIYVLH